MTSYVRGNPKFVSRQSPTSKDAADLFQDKILMKISSSLIIQDTYAGWVPIKATAIIVQL